MCSSMKSILPRRSPGRPSGWFPTILPLPGESGRLPLPTRWKTRPFRSQYGRWPVKPAACLKRMRRKRASASSEEHADRFTSDVQLLPCPATFLVLLAAAAGARIVAPHLLARPPLRRLAGVSARAAGRLQLSMLLALKFFLERVDGGRGLPRVDRNLTRLGIHRQGARGAGHRRRGGNSPADARRRIHPLGVRGQYLYPGK